jgi:hypothetical protein
MVTKVKPNINSVEVHPQLSNNGHPVDGALMGSGSLWLHPQTLAICSNTFWIISWTENLIVRQFFHTFKGFHHHFLFWTTLWSKPTRVKQYPRCYCGALTFLSAAS